MSLTTTLHEKATANTPSVYLVHNEHESLVGMLEKYRNTSADTHPWKAYAGAGKDRVLLGFYYATDEYYNIAPEDRQNCSPGSYHAALAAIKEYAESDKIIPVP